MIRHQHGCPFTDKKLRAVNALGLYVGNFFEQLVRIDDHARARKSRAPVVKNAARNQVQLEYAFVVDNGMPRVVSSLITHYQVGVLRKIINHLALSLVAPLRSHYNPCRHNPFLLFSRCNLHKKSIDFRLCPSLADSMRKDSAARLRVRLKNKAHRPFLLSYYIIFFPKLKMFFCCLNDLRHILFCAFPPFDSGIVAFISFRRTIYRLNLFRFHILIEIQNYLLLIYKYFIFKRRVLHCFFIIPYR